METKRASSDDSQSNLAGPRPPGHPASSRAKNEREIRTDAAVGPETLGVFSLSSKLVSMSVVFEQLSTLTARFERCVNARAQRTRRWGWRRMEGSSADSTLRMEVDDRTESVALVGTLILMPTSCLSSSRRRSSWLQPRRSPGRSTRRIREECSRHLDLSSIPRRRLASTLAMSYT